MAVEAEMEAASADCCGGSGCIRLRAATLTAKSFVGGRGMAQQVQSSSSMLSSFMKASVFLQQRSTIVGRNPRWRSRGSDPPSLPGRRPQLRGCRKREMLGGQPAAMCPVWDKWHHETHVLVSLISHQVIQGWRQRQPC